MIKLFINGVQMRLLNGKTTDVDWYYSRHHQKNKFLVYDLLSKPFVKDSNGGEGQSHVATIVFFLTYCKQETKIYCKIQCYIEV